MLNGFFSVSSKSLCFLSSLRIGIPILINWIDNIHLNMHSPFQLTKPLLLFFFYRSDLRYRNVSFGNCNFFTRLSDRVLQEGGGPSKNLSEYLQGSEARKVARAANSSGVPPKT